MSYFKFLLRIGRDILETVVSLIVLSPVYILALFPIVVVSLLHRLVVSLYIRVKYENGQVSVMSVMDGNWAFETKSSTSTPQGLYIIKGTFNPTKFRATIDKVVRSEYIGGRLSRSITSILGVPCWKQLQQDEMNMMDYCRVVLDDEERGFPTTQDELFAFLSSKEVPIAKGSNKAPWQIFVIPRIQFHNTTNSDTSTPHYAIVVEVHHAIMDGISGLNMLYSVLADKPFALSMDPCTMARPHFLKTWLTYALGILSLPRTMMRSSYLKDQYFKPGPAPELTGPKTLAWTRPIKLDALKQIKTITKTSMVSILLSSLGAGFKSLHRRNGETTVPAKFHALVVIVMLPYPKNRALCNRASAILSPSKIPSPSDTPISSLKDNHQLLTVSGRSDSIVLAAANSFYPKLTGLLPLPLHRPLGLPLHVRLTLSNLPGPKEEVFINGGDKIVDMGFWVPIKYRIGLGVGSISYNNRVRVSFIGDEVYYPHEGDVQFLATAFEQELQRLGDFVGVHDVFY